MTKPFKIAENICEIISNEQINQEYKRIKLRAGPIAITAQPGQFFHLACPPTTTEQPLLRRPMSVYRIDKHHDELHFLYKVQGPGTRGLASLQPSQTLDAFGPLGKGFNVPEATRHLLLLARGVGLATMAPLAEHAITQGTAVTALLSARSPDLVMSEQYLQSVGARTIAVTDTEDTSSVTHVEQILRQHHAENPFDRLATCGSNRLLHLAQRLGREWAIPGEVALEQHMGCAIGMCYACVREFRKAPDSDEHTYRRVCWEGPVFDLQEALSW